MKRILVLILALMLTAACGWHCLGRISYASGPIPNEVYIWQRAWTPALRDSISANAPVFSAIVPLAAEVSFVGGRSVVTRIAIDYPALARVHAPQA